MSKIEKIDISTINDPELLKYADIINLDHPEPLFHTRMDKLSRANQFASFKALTGFEDTIDEVKRLVDIKIELADYDDLNIILKELKEKDKVLVTYFIKDKLKEGGKYIEKELIFKRINEQNKEIIFDNKIIIKLENIIEIKKVKHDA